MKTLASDPAPECEPCLLGGGFAGVGAATGIAAGVITGARGAAAIDAVRARLSDGRYPLEHVDCLCGARQAECVATHDRYGLPHRTVLCTRCGLLRTDPRMTRAAYADFYAHHYRAIYERPDHDPARYFGTQAGRGEKRARFVLHDIVAPAAGARVAEIGCGAGWNLLPYLQRGWHAVGWDVDDGYLALGAARGLDLRHGLLPDACASNERFHLILLSHVLEHFLDPIADLRALRAMLHPQGALFVEVPSLFAAAQLGRYFQGAHTWSFVPATLEATMRAAGFRRVAMNGMIESLWQRSEGPAQPMPADPALVQRTRAFLRSREESSALAIRLAAMQQRAWRVRDALRIRARLRLTEA